ncbi:hypothetical protein J2S28_005707 [Rhizobium sp. SLBN-94]|nr:hypothetical protein [Rhizobium sp. SLBN-94]
MRDILRWPVKSGYRAMDRRRDKPVQAIGIERTL